MVIAVIVVFAVCWLPYQTYFVANLIYPPINSWEYINVLFFCFHWLAMSSSCYNPFIYGIFSEKFKREYKIRICCYKEGSIAHPTDEDTEVEASTYRTSIRRFVWSRGTTRQVCRMERIQQQDPDFNIALPTFNRNLVNAGILEETGFINENLNIKSDNVVSL